MKKKDIIQLVKKIVKENNSHTTFYGNREQPSTLGSTSAIASAGKDPYTGKNEYPFSARPKRTGSGYMQEEESTSFKVVNADTGKTIDFGLDKAKALEIAALAIEDNINAEVVKMKNVDDVGKLKNEAGPSNNPYYNNLVKKAEEMGIHVNDLMKSLLKDKSEMEIVKMGYQDVAALAGVENLKEFTSMGQEGIYPRKEEPGDMFQQKEVEELLPNGMASRDDREFQARLKQHADWTEESGYNNTFVHIQYHDSFDREHSYRIHQSQNYNGNYKDFRNPKFTVLTITKKKEGKEEELGRYIVDTDAYLKDFAKLRNDDVLGKQVSEDYKPSHRAYNVIDKSDNDKIVANGKELSRDKALKLAHTNKDYMISATDTLAETPMFKTDVKQDMAPKEMAGRIKSVFDKVNGAKDPVQTPEWHKNRFKSKYGISFPEDIKNINKEQALAMNKYSNDMKITEADLYTVTSTDNEEKQVSFPDSTTAMQAASKNANIKQVVKLESEEAFGSAGTDKRSGQTIGIILQLIKSTGIDPEEVIEAINLNKMNFKNSGLPKMDPDNWGFSNPNLKETPDDDEDEERGWMDGHLQEYMKKRGNDDLMERMDKHRKRSRLMEGATEKLFKLFNQGKTDSEVRSIYLQQNIDMPESFVAKLRNNWESLRKTKLDLTLADKEAEGFEAIQQAAPVSGMEGGEIDGMEETKTLASGLFTK